MRTLLVSLFLAVLLSGCVAPIQATRDLPQPQSLAEVNALLDGKHVDIELVDGQVVRGVREASVEPETVSYRVESFAARRMTLPVGDVTRITYVRNRGTRHGAAAGAVPGIALFGLGVAGAFAYDDDSSVSPGLAFAVGAGLGAVAAAVLVPVGAWVGQAVSPGGVVPLYEAPVERYLGADTGGAGR